MAKKRSIKVISQSGHNYKVTPTIVLKGQWLKELGFDIGDYVSITCENGKLVITPDTERAAIAEAEAAFMEREMEAMEGLVDLKKQILDSINKVEDPELRTLLELRYISYMSWENIASEMFYGIDNVFKLHRKALEQIEVPVQ